MRSIACCRSEENLKGSDSELAWRVVPVAACRSLSTFAALSRIGTGRVEKRSAVAVAVVTRPIRRAPLPSLASLLLRLALAEALADLGLALGSDDRR
jgi:hypothetical protein